MLCRNNPKTPTAVLVKSAKMTGFAHKSPSLPECVGCVTGPPVVCKDDKLRCRFIESSYLPAD